MIEACPLAICVMSKPASDRRRVSRRARSTGAVGGTWPVSWIVIGPSNPVISIGPILAVPGIRDAMAEARAPVVAVSPFVAGRAIKGPTEAFMEAIGRPVSAAGVASLYAGLLDGIVVDEGDPDPPPEGLEALVCPTLMEGANGRVGLADRILDWAEALS